MAASFSEKDCRNVYDSMMYIFVLVDIGCTGLSWLENLFRRSKPKTQQSNIAHSCREIGGWNDGLVPGLAGFSTSVSKTQPNVRSCAALHVNESMRRLTRSEILTIGKRLTLFPLTSNIITT